MKDHSELGGMFDMTGVVRGEDGIKRYEGLPRNLVQMFRAAVDRDGAAEAVVETGGGPRLSYASLWDRAARVAGGLRGLGVQRGDRVAIRIAKPTIGPRPTSSAARPSQGMPPSRPMR
jgi:hypothetical protein